MPLKLIAHNMKKGTYRVDVSEDDLVILSVGVDMHISELQRRLGRVSADDLFGHKALRLAIETAQRLHDTIESITGASDPA